MEQLRLGFPPREAANPLTRLLMGLGTVVVGMVLALAGILMMVPLILVAATVLALMARTSARKPRPYRSPPAWH
jgi:Flp pilus assembly protein TadB